MDKLFHPFKHLLVLLFVVLQHQVSAQLVTDPTMTPTQLVEDVLVGAGVSVSNVNYTGSPNAIGYFDGSNCNVGINSGIILTTGTILNTNAGGIPEGPHGPNTEGGAGLDNNEPGDPLLTAAAGNPSFNAARLEFDFTPQSDSIEFDFVFASEEYLEFVNAGVNDAFGFFISGPNPAGGNYTDQNIALVPGTTTPITIDNVNSTVNPQYYIDNGDGFTAPFNGDPSYIQYDGLTTLLTASANVVCGETYHIIIVISDIGDGILDSGVFLEAGSFSSPSIDISSDLSFQGSIANDSTLFEGCSEATLWFVRNDSINFEQILPIQISGDAQNGSDYTTLPNSITFPPGEDSVSLTINAIFDNLPEGTETIQVNITLPSTCTSTAIQDSVILYIANVDELTAHVENDTIDCLQSEATLMANAAGGTAGYSYLWNTGETTQVIHASPTVTTDYHVTITDTCGQIAMDTATVHVTPPAPLNLAVSNDTLIHCIGNPIEITATPSGGGGNYTITWNTNSTGSPISVTPNETTTYTVTVEDQCGSSISDSITVSVQEIPLSIQAFSDTTVCAGETVTLSAIASGGYGSNYSYLWSTNSTDQSISVAPEVTTNYIVGAADECGTIKAWDTVTVTIHVVNANFVVPGPFEENVELQFTNTSINADQYFWTFDNGLESTITNPSTVYENDGNYVVTLIATNSENGCTDTTSQVLQINPEFYFYIPNAFTPDGDDFNETFFGIGTGLSSYKMSIYNRWGERIFETNELFGVWNGMYKGEIMQSGVYTYVFEVENLVNEVIIYTGHVNLLR